MKLIARTSFVFAFAAVAALAQQPNSGYASMQINGSDLGVYPILTNVRTSLPAGFAFAGATNQPYVVYQTNGALAVGTATIPASNGQNSVDIPLSPFPAKVIDGFVNPIFQTDFSGTAGFALLVPPAGSPPNGVPLGTQFSLQGLLADPFSSIGFSLTAATRVTVTQGPSVTYMSLGDDTAQSISTGSMTLPFYGVNYTTLFVNSNGYVCLGSTDTPDYIPSLLELLTGPPRIAPFWTDLICPANGVKVTIDSPQGGLPGYARVDFLDAQSWGTGQTHNFSMLLQSDGYLEMIHATTNNASLYDQVTGIAAGSSVGGTSQPEKNFVGPPPNGSSLGQGILTTAPYTHTGGVHEAFFEWYGILAQHAYYASPLVPQPQYTHTFDNPYDLFARTMRFLPNGSGSLPASTNRYVLY